MSRRRCHGAAEHQRRDAHVGRGRGV